MWKKEAVFLLVSATFFLPKVTVNGTGAQGVQCQGEKGSWQR